MAFQYLVVFGDSVHIPAVEMSLRNSDGTHQVIDCHRRVVKMDARLPHEFRPYKGRICFIKYFKRYDRRLDGELPVFEPGMVL